MIFVSKFQVTFKPQADSSGLKDPLLLNYFILLIKSSYQQRYWIDECFPECKSSTLDHLCLENSLYSFCRDFLRVTRLTVSSIQKEIELLNALIGKLPTGPPTDFMMDICFGHFMVKRMVMGKGRQLRKIFRENHLNGNCSAVKIFAWAAAWKRMINNCG